MKQSALPGIRHRVPDRSPDTTFQDLPCSHQPAPHTKPNSCLATALQPLSSCTFHCNQTLPPAPVPSPAHTPSPCTLAAPRGRRCSPPSFTTPNQPIIPRGSLRQAGASGADPGCGWWCRKREASPMLSALPTERSRAVPVLAALQWECSPSETTPSPHLQRSQHTLTGVLCQHTRTRCCAPNRHGAEDFCLGTNTQSRFEGADSQL